MKQKKFVAEMGKCDGGRQWIHLFKTNVKARCTIEDIVLWEGELIPKDEMERLALADPNFKPKKSSAAASAPPGGVWRT